MCPWGIPWTEDSIRSWRCCLQGRFGLVDILRVAYHRISEGRGEMSDQRRVEDSELESDGRARIADKLRERGVVIPDPDRTYVDESVDVASGTVLYPGTHLRGATSVGPDCRIGPDCWIEDTTVEGRCTVRYSVLEGAHVRVGSDVGPYTHLRPGADVGPEARVGNFVEVKNARLE